MDLLEYQAKKLFQQVGIPVLSSQPIQDTGELKWLRIPYPVVLKSQVHAGGRGRAGGVRFVENTIDAIAAANAIFNLSISGEYPEVILAEAHYDAIEEFFLAVVLDYQLQRPVLLGSAKGGTDVETLIAHLQKVVIEGDFSPFHARRLVMKMGIKGTLIGVVSGIIEKIYELFRDKDLDLVEINPLALSHQGEVMALDGKITLNDAAIIRHPDLIRLTTPPQIPSNNSTTAEKELSQPLAPTIRPQWQNTSASQGNIAVITNSTGLGLAFWDLIEKSERKGNCCYIVAENQEKEAIKKELNLILSQVAQSSEVNVIVINWLASEERCLLVVEGLADYLKTHQDPPMQGTAEDRAMRPTRIGRNSRSTPRKPQKSPVLTQFVLHIVGENGETLKQTLTESSVHWTDSLDHAVSQSLSLAKS